MSWPTMTDYQEAIQNPRLCFADPVLGQGSPALDRLGLPRPVTGAFAIVYQINCNGRKYAVRCFLHYHPDQEQRYAVISRYLKKTGLPCMVDFEFLARGIRVRNHWYPILKMEWIDGDPLNSYIDKNLHNPRAIQDLARNFICLTADLRRWSISHGDLQHGNILIFNGSLKLIDYDGMYVPGLEDLSSHELGHQNYQHPRRTEKDFGPGLDNFSTWVIYTALAALSADPGLWQRAGAGDEYLLFRRKDFESPGISSMFFVLKQLQTSRVQSLSSFVLSFTGYTDLSKIPALDDTLATQPVLPGALVTALPDWIDNLVKPGPPAKAYTTIQKSRSVSPSWIQDHIVQTSPAPMMASSFLERFLLGTFIALTVFLFYACSSGLLTPLSSAAAFCSAFTLTPLLFVLRFHSLPDVSKKYKLRVSERVIQKDIKRLERVLKRLSARINKLNEEEKKKIDSIAAKQSEIAQTKKSELDSIAQELKGILAKINLQRLPLKQAEADEITQALHDLQKNFLPQKLASHEIARASIRGIGPEMKKRLLAAGIKTAGDIVSLYTIQSKTVSHEIAFIEVLGRGKVYIEGMGPQKANAILAWRLELEAVHKKQIPKSLSPDQESTIKLKYQKSIQALDAWENAARQDERQRVDAIRANLQQEQATLANQARRVRNRFIKMQQNVEQEIKENENQLSLKKQTLAKLQQELEGLRQVNFKAYLKHIFLTL